MFFIWVILIALLQATVLKGVNLLAVLAVFSGLKKGPVKGLLMGSAIGGLCGILSASSFGLNVALYSLVGFASGSFRAYIYYKENIFMEIIFSFCGLMLFYFAYFIISRTLQMSVFSTALFSAALSPVLFRIVGGRQHWAR